MTDFASLGIQIDSRSVPPAVGELDKLTAAGGRAEKAIDKLGDEAAQTGAQVKGASAIAAQYAADAQKMANTARLSGTNIAGLGTASSLAKTNVKALGSEIGILAGGLTTGGIGAQGMASSLGRLTVAAGILSPLVIGLATATALLGSALLGVKQGAASDAEMKKFADSLGLTRKEMEKLTDVTVTWGDTFKAILDVIAEQSGSSAANVQGFFANAFLKVGEFGKFSAQIILAAFAASIKGVISLFSNLPGIVGNAAVGAANFAISAFEKMANLGVLALNKIGGGLNAIFHTSIPQVASVSLGRINASFKGSFGQIGKDVHDQFLGTFRDVEAGFNKISGRASEFAQDRIKDQADDIIADRTNKAASAHANRAKAAKDEAEALDKLAKERAKLLQIGDISAELKKSGETPLDIGKPNFGNFGGALDQDTLLAGPNALLAALDAIAQQASVTGQALSSSFGDAGNVIGNLVAGIADYAAERQALGLEVLKGNLAQEVADKRLHTLGVRNTAQAIAGVKSLFKEKSTAFKVISAVEKAYAVWEAANTIASMVRDAAKTASSVANSAVRTTANTAEGGSKIFAELGPWAFPVVAAMVGVLAALGAKGGGGGSSGPNIPTAQDLQDRAGTGSVLGDAKAKSDSIAHSLEIVAANTNKDLEYTNQMLKALHSIDFSIAKLAGTVAKQIQVSGSLFDTSKLSLGSTGSGGFLGIGASQTTKSLFDLGINLGSASVASIISGGISGSTYQTVEKIKKKSGFLGIGGGTKTSYKTTTGAIDPEIAAAIQDVVMSLRDGLLASADVIGLQGAEAILNSFNVSIGKISFKDMTGEQIESQLNAIFSNVGDQMAGAIFPTLKTMQKIGEGLFETFIRVAREYEVVDIALRSIGKEFGAIGINSVAARDALVQLFGGLDEFVEATSFFGDQFLSDAERIAPVAAAVKAELARLGMAGITTRDQFKQAVLGLDLTTAAGREMYAALLKVAPAFDKTLDFFEAANKTVVDGLKSTVQQFTNFAESLRKYRDTLFATGTQAASYGALRGKFIATATLAGTGDATALGGLEASGKAFLDAAKNNASTLVQYLRDVALVANGVDKGIFAAEATADYAQLQLDALENAVSILGQIATNTAPATLAAPAGGTQSLPSNETADPVIVAQNQTIIDQNAQILELMKRQERLWTRFDGDGLLIRTDSDSPIQTEIV